MIQYPFHLQGKWYGRHDPVLVWLDKFALQIPIRPGVWQYTRHYNSGDLAAFDIRYDADGERFRGTVRWEMDEAAKASQANH